MARKKHNLQRRISVLRRKVFGNSRFAIVLRRSYFLVRRFVGTPLKRSKYAVRRFMLRQRLIISKGLRFFHIRILRKPITSDDIRLPLRYPAVALSTKSIAWLLILSLQLITLQKAANTYSYSYFHDTEVSTNNQYVSSVLDLHVDAGDNFNVEITPQESLNRIFGVENVGSIPFQYDAVSDNLGNNIDVCNVLRIDVSHENNLIYTEALTNFQLPTSTLDLVETEALDFEVVLTSDAGIGGETCTFDMLWRAWQIDAGNYTNGITLSDTEIVANSVTVEAVEEPGAGAASSNALILKAAPIADTNGGEPEEVVDELNPPDKPTNEEEEVEEVVEPTETEPEVVEPVVIEEPEVTTPEEEEPKIEEEAHEPVEEIPEEVPLLLPEPELEPEE